MKKVLALRVLAVNKYFVGVLFVFMLLAMPILSFSSESNEAIISGEKQMFGELKTNIPKERIKTADELYKKWEEMQEGKSKAIIIDVRTEAEFDSGHIQNSSNVDLGLVYSLPEKIQDTNTEIWVLCRTQHRATYFTGLLYKYGYKNVYIVEKGIVGWIEKGYPLINKYMGEFKVMKYQNKVKETFAFRDNK